MSISACTLLLHFFSFSREQDKSGSATVIHDYKTTVKVCHPQCRQFLTERAAGSVPAEVCPLIFLQAFRFFRGQTAAILERKPRII